MIPYPEYRGTEFGLLLDERVAGLEERLTGLTVNGAVQRGLFALQASSGVATAELAEAALAFLGALSTEQRLRAVFPLDAAERRMCTVDLGRATAKPQAPCPKSITILMRPTSPGWVRSWTAP